MQPQPWPRGVRTRFCWWCGHPMQAGQLYVITERYGALLHDGCQFQKRGR